MAACGGAEKSAGSACEQVTLAKDDGQWRIQHLPANLLIDQISFTAHNLRLHCREDARMRMAQ